MKEFRTLTLAKNLFLEIQKTKLPYFAKNQLSRAAYSVVMNLGEGDGYKSQAQRKKFFEIAHGSAKEVKVGLSVFPVKPALSNQADALCAHTYNLTHQTPKHQTHMPPP